jgi:N-acetylglutamate synthase-like GNAT family acetyltransferase
MVEIRRASVDDVAGIAAIIQDVWAQEIDLPYCHDLISAEKQHVWVAEQSGEIAGFVAGFLTTGRDNLRRWEVDLLAVRTTSQGQRLGQRLVEAITVDAETQHVDLIRGLIRVGNIASQRSFERAGYHTDEQTYKMVFWSPQKSDAKLPADEAIIAIPVDTLTYRGLWLEGLELPRITDSLRRATIIGGQALAGQEGRLSASALIPIEKILLEDLTQYATIHGHHQWWHK